MLFSDRKFKKFKKVHSHFLSLNNI